MWKIHIINYCKKNCRMIISSGATSWRQIDIVCIIPMTKISFFNFEHSQRRNQLHHSTIKSVKIKFSWHCVLSGGTQRSVFPLPERGNYNNNDPRVKSNLQLSRLPSHACTTTAYTNTTSNGYRTQNHHIKV